MGIDKREVLKQITSAVIKGEDSLAMNILEDFAKHIWVSSQKDANGFRMDKYGDKGKYPAATLTPYKETKI